jgi:acylphosphatase
MRWYWPGHPASQQPDRSTMATDPPAVRLDATVSGRVQGVGFRYFVLREATDLGLTGWVANTRDGSVRCVAEGPRDRLDILLDRLRAGPPAAIVDHVSEMWMPATGTLGLFGVRSGDHRGD